MSDERRRAFLSTGTRTGHLATVMADGSPHVAPIWFVLDGDDVVFTTAAGSVKGRNLAREPRVALSVDDPAPPYGFVHVRGTVTTSDDLDEMLTWATRIGARYMGADLARRFGERNAVPGELLCRLTPNHMVAQEAVAD